MKKLSRPTLFVLAFILINLVWRLIFLPVSQGCYTDGILQIDMFRQGLSYWPPFYALTVRLFSWIPGLGLEGAGRLVSFLSGIVILLPLAAATRRLYGLRAAIWTMVAWTASAMALQWSLQVMTDMFMTLLWMGALAALVLAVEAYLPGLFPQSGSAPAPNPRGGNHWLLLASFCGAFATLTRYQGIFLLLPLAWAAWKLGCMTKRLPARSFSPWLTLLPWLAVPIWLVQGMGSIAKHGEQIGARAGSGGLWTALTQIYWYNFEEFLLKSPYFLTYGLFGFMLYGLFRTQWGTARLRWAGWICLYLALGIFGLQSVFSSYQSRYLLPLVPLACIFAGHGLATWERHNERHPVRLWGLVLPTVVWGLIFSAMVAVYQGSPFKEIKEAAQFVRTLNPPKSVRIVSNEIYNASIGAAKVSFWSGRDNVAFLRGVSLKQGDIIVFSSAYAGGLGAYHEMRTQLMQSLPARMLHRPFARYALPLLTDLMQEPMTNQNPLAFYLRYQPQYFETTVLQVTGPGLEDLPMPVVPPKDASSDKAIEKLEAIHKEIQQMKR